MSDRPASRVRLAANTRENLTLIAFGTLMMAITLMILSFFNTARAGGQPIPAAPIIEQSRAIAIPTEQPLVVTQAQAPVASSAEDLLRAAVERANRAFIEARAQANPTPLQGIATGAWLTEEQNYLADLRARGQTERWRLIRLEYVQVQPQGATGFVCTSETWEVTTIGQGGAAGTVRSYTFSEGYYLNQQSGSWVVNRIDIS